MMQELLLGAHTSAAGGVHHALLEGKAIGATTIQLFTSNQRQWRGKTLAQQEIDKWHEVLQETGLKQIMSHDSYLINLGSPDGETLAKSRQTFAEEFARCKQLAISYLNFHPGAALTADVQSCLDRIVESLLLLEKSIDSHSPRLLLESTAGQGTTVGYCFEHLAYIIGKTASYIPIGVCIDTCHIFAAGYDIRTKESLDNVLNEFDKVVGLKHLYAFHLNDSQKELGSRVDRHSNLGEGKIGLETFRLLMQHPKTKALPKYLETPGGVTTWEKEIKLLREFTKEI